MVIFRTADGQPGYHQAEELADAVQFVERLRNSEGVEHTRIFRLEEVEFDFKPYYKVEVPTGAPAPGFEAPAPEVPAFEAPSFEPAPLDVPTAEVVPEPAPVAPAMPAAAPVDLPPAAEAPSWPTEPPPAVAEVPPPPPPPISVPDPIPEPALGISDPGGMDAVPPPPPPAVPLDASEVDGEPVGSGSNGLSARRGLFGR
jgi:hypothetical protein